MSRAANHFQLSRADKTAGFTLLEIIIAVFISAIIGILAMNILTEVETGRFQAQESSEQFEKLVNTMSLLQQDVNHVVLRPVRNNYGDQIPLMRGRTESDQSYLEFTRAAWRNPATLPRSELQHLVYKLEGTKLYRYSWLFLDQADELSASKRLLLDDVKNLKVEFLEEDQWREFWLSESVLEREATVLPRAVRVTLETDQFGEITRLLPINGGEIE